MENSDDANYGSRQLRALDAPDHDLGAGADNAHVGQASVAIVAGDSGDALRQDLAVLARAPGVVLDGELLAAYAASAAANSLRAFRADVVAFDTWCHTRGCRCLPAGPELAAGFLKSRAEQGAAPASLTRYRASIAKLHRLCRLPDPRQDELVKLTLAAHRRAMGVAQKQARPLRFKGVVKDPLTDAPRYQHPGRSRGLRRNTDRTA